jgi:signal transduction histidine kinase
MSRRRAFLLLLTRRSLTAGLALRAILVVLLGMALISAAASWAVSGVVNRALDGQLRMGAHMLISLMSEEMAARRASAPHIPPSCQQPLLSAEDREAFSDFARWRMFRVWYGDRMCWSSQTGPRLSNPQGAPSSVFAETRSGGHIWRYYTLTAANQGPIVQVGEDMHVRGRIVMRVALALIAPFMLIAALLMVVLFQGLRDGLKGLDRFGARLAAQNDRPPFDPLLQKDWPVELHPLVASVNQLFHRIEAGAQRERGFIDRAAHQLRTPLSALSIEAQLAARAETTEERSGRLVGLNASVRRVAALVDQLLALAYVEGAERGPQKATIGEPVSAREIISDILADQAPLAAQRGVELSLEGDDVSIKGDARALHLLLANVIDNAVRYTPDGGEVGIIMRSQGEGGLVTVQDSGPGLNDPDKGRAFERFWRAPNAHQTGSGLGLAIAAEAATALDAHIRLRDRDDGRSGLCVEARFGPFR